ncbi:MAG: SPOR domain-containing protein [Cellvibrionaceae bacterium]
MRWIVGSLIFANVLVFTWYMLAGENNTVVASPGARQSALGSPSIELLSEVGSQQSLDLDDEIMSPALKDELPAVPETDKDGNPLCTLVGPFSKLLRAEYFIEKLAALDVPSSVYDVEIPGDVGYWVFLPPEESRKQAYNKLRELQAKGVDSYVIPKGELENGISFGMFSRSELAEQRLKDMTDQGYPAELKEIARSYKEIWVLLQPGQAKLIGENAWLEMLSADEGIERRQNYCPAVASK